ncbi:histidinol dehydrogenase [Hydrogenothermus marinus]|uniref:Histidinol dehydrogenase n=1 Tax=Hydrogenothermus marinus TaxID=133270 RepID=A0A3M0C2R5_9AQUI|nr:histidinol dehydrogenase [Hydrogenothermus marinus]RMA97242.1 histidinol dehydrogenase [Hydrogenothermus marinus]
MKIVDLRHKDFTKDEDIQKLIKRSEVDFEEYEKSVKEIIKNVKEKGDKALIEYTEKFDNIKINSPDELVIGFEELEEAYVNIEDDVRNALEVAAERVMDFHQSQLENSYINEEEGIILGQKVIPLEKVGLYVPGGKAAYPSSVIMNAIPAVVAGVKNIYMTSPNPNKYTLAAAYICGIEKVYRLGGAQAIAALAYGTETVEKVDKIVGPGNIYVALAKKNVYGVVGIDSIAGPSEILVIADKTANPKWIAADLLSQAEHDEMAASILITDDENLAERVHDAIYADLLLKMPRRDIIEKSLNNYGKIFIVNNIEEACAVANFIAPEHLELVVKEPFSYLNDIENAGAIFLGEYSTEPLGDYVLGPNHVLPTAGTARFSSPLGVYDFVKRSSVIYVSKKGFDRVSKIASDIAKAEGLIAHKLSVDIRRKD